MSVTNGAIAAGLAQGLARVFTTIGVAAVGVAALIEGVTLKGARLLADRQETTSKIAKVALGVIALAAACIATGGVGLATIFAISIYTSSTAIPLIIGAALAIATLPAHYKAFQWAKLV